MMTPIFMRQKATIVVPGDVSDEDLVRLRLTGVDIILDYSTDQWESKVVLDATSVERVTLDHGIGLRFAGTATFQNQEREIDAMGGPPDRPERLRRDG